MFHGLKLMSRLNLNVTDCPINAAGVLAFFLRIKSLRKSSWVWMNSWDLCLSKTLAKAHHRKIAIGSFCHKWHLYPNWMDFSLVVICSYVNWTVGFNRQAKLFELNFFIRKTFVYMVKPGRQNHPHSWSICPVASPKLVKPLLTWW